jgi:hypothetical protein
MRWLTAGNLIEDNFIFGGKLFGYLSIQFILWVNVNEMADHRRYDWRFFHIWWENIQIFIKDLLLKSEVLDRNWRTLTDHNITNLQPLWHLESYYNTQRFKYDHEICYSMFLNERSMSIMYCVYAKHILYGLLIGFNQIFITKFKKFSFKPCKWDF